jgi:hypothetical protein
MNNEERLKALEELKAKRKEIQENITKERLLELCFEMHKWIYLHTGDEEEAYNEIGLTDEENFLFGYRGKLNMEVKIDETVEEHK